MLWQRLAKSPAVHFCLLVAFALAIRALHLVEVAGTPFYRHVTEPDSAVYIEQGQAVADGDWLGREVFNLSPLYRYLLGVILKLADGDLLAVRVVQSFLGALCCGLVYLIGRDIWGAPQGLVAGTILAIYGPGVFYESKILNEAWVISANLAAVLCLLSYRKRPKPGLLALCGLFLGISSILRANGTLLTALFACAAWFYHPSRSWKLRIGHFAAYAAGWSAAGLPVLVRNWVVGGQFVLLVTNLGPELYMGSHPDSPGVGFGVPHFIAPHPRTISEGFREQATLVTGEDVTHEEASRFWVRETLKAVAKRPGDYFRLLRRKFDVATNNFEATDNTVYEYEKGQSRTLAFTFVGFGLLLALSAPGLVLALRGERAAQLPLFGVLAAYAASLAMVAIIGRYRLPMVPVMSLYAAVLLTAVGRWARERRWLPPLAAFWAFSALLGFAFHESPLVKEMKQERMAEACHRLARIHQTEGRPVEALETTQRAIDWFPEAAELYLIPGLPYERMNPYQLTWARRKANVDHRLAPSDDMVTCARILEEGGSPEWAEKVLRRAFVFYRHSDVVLGELLGVLWRQGKRDAMEELLERTSYSNPKSPAAAYFRALTEPGGSDKGFFLPASGFEAVHSAEIEFRNGRFVQACRLLQVAWQGGFAHSAEANYLLARCWSEIGDLGKATEHLKLAAELSPDYVRLAQYEGELIQLKAASRAEDPAHRERLAQAYLSGWRIRDFAEVQKWERPPGVEAVFPRLKASDADFEPIR